MGTDFLERILEHKKQVIKTKKAFYDSLKEKLSKESFTRYQLFKRMISAANRISLIAEIKKASPSRGILREDFDLLQIAKVYCDNKAAAISVLTEDKFFLGKPEYIKKVSDNYRVPVLCKDFIIDDGQIYEAALNGASAVLLIVSILNDKDLGRLQKVAQALDIDTLVEVHDEEELKRALGIGAEIIGINNRDLKTFAVTLQTCEKLIPKIPKDKIIVAESGIRDHQDVQRVRALGAHAVLIGEIFMQAADIGKKIKEVMGSS